MVGQGDGEGLARRRGADRAGDNPGRSVEHEALGQDARRNRPGVGLGAAGALEGLGVVGLADGRSRETGRGYEQRLHEDRVEGGVRGDREGLTGGVDGARAVGLGAPTGEGVTTLGQAARVREHGDAHAGVVGAVGVDRWGARGGGALVVGDGVGRRRRGNVDDAAHAGY